MNHSTSRRATPSSRNVLERAILLGLALLSFALPGLAGCRVGVGTGSGGQVSWVATGSEGGGGDGDLSSTAASYCLEQGKGCAAAGDCCSGVCGQGFCGASGDCLPDHALCDGTVPCCNFTFCDSFCGGF